MQLNRNYFTPDTASSGDLASIIQFSALVGNANPPEGDRVTDFTISVQQYFGNTNGNPKFGEVTRVRFTPLELVWGLQDGILKVFKSATTGRVTLGLMSPKDAISEGRTVDVLRGGGWTPLKWVKMTARDVFDYDYEIPYEPITNRQVINHLLFDLHLGFSEVATGLGFEEFVKREFYGAHSPSEDSDVVRKARNHLFGTEVVRDDRGNLEIVTIVVTSPKEVREYKDGTLVKVNGRPAEDYGAIVEPLLYGKTSTIESRLGSIELAILGLTNKIDQLILAR